MHLLNLAIITIHSPFVIDSVIYSMNIQKLEIVQQKLSSEIIDYGVDDFLYVLTKRFLHKIDPDNLTVKDRIPLPQRFNYMTTNSRNLMLITTGEIILIDKTNLAYRSGVGIEHGDYRPIILHQGPGLSGQSNIIHLMTDSGDKTIMKIFNLDNGRLIRKITVKKIVAYEYDPEQNTLITLDITNRLTVYDIHLRNIKTVRLNINGNWFGKCKDGYMIYNEQGLFFVNRKGKLLDFQPIRIMEPGAYEKFTFLTKTGIVQIDSLTLRPRIFLENNQEMMRLLHCDYPDYALGLDSNRNFHLIDTYQMTVKPITERKLIAKTIEPIEPVVYVDSLWYFQLGAFAHVGNAIDMYNDLRQNNIPVFVDSTDLYRVKLGGFQDKIMAMEMIENADLNGWFLFQQKFEHKDSIEFFVDEEKYIFKDGIIRKD